MGLFSSIGNAFNSLTGASSAGKESYKYSSMLAAQNAAYQKEFAQNAHQWEVEDLKKAGLNPILSAGGSGASASGGGGGTVSVGAGAGGFSDIMNSAAGLMKVGKELGLLDAQEEQTRTTTEAIKGKTPKEMDKLDSETAKNYKEIEKIGSDVMLNSAKALEAKTNAVKNKAGIFGYGGTDLYEGFHKVGKKIDNLLGL